MTRGWLCLLTWKVVEQNNKTTFRSFGISALAPEVGFEPTANTLTAYCSTAELLRIMVQVIIVRIDPVSQ